MPRTASSKSPKPVSRTVYSTLAQDARQREEAAEHFAGSVSAALVARFDDVHNLFGIPMYLRPRVEAAAKAAGLNKRDYLIKVLTEHALGLPATAEEKAQKSPSSRG